MITYTLPEEAKKTDKEEKLGEAAPDTDWRRRITLPANQAILNACKVGDEVKVTLYAKVEGQRMEDSRHTNDRSVDINLSSVSVVNADEEDAESAMESGYRKASGRK